MRAGDGRSATAILYRAPTAACVYKRPRALNRMASDLRNHEEALRAESADLAAKNAKLERFT